MEALRHFLAGAASSKAARGSSGKTTDWLLFTELVIKTRRLLICDFQFVPKTEDGLVVELEPGEYRVEATGMDFDGDRRISGLRVIRPNSTATRGNRLGETWTDTATCSVCELDAVQKEWNSLGEEPAADKLMEEYERGEGCGIFRVTECASVIPYVSSGFGDGAFPVFELIQDGKRVGIEVEFISPNNGYPFGPTKPLSSSPQEEDRRRGLNEQMARLIANLKESKTGDAKLDREKAKEIFATHLSGLEQKALEPLAELRKHVQQTRRKAVPWFLKLSPAEAQPLAEEPVVKVRVEALLAAGFTPVGCFQMNLAQNSFMLVFVDAAGMYGTIHKAGPKAVFTVTVEYRDGRLVEFTESAAVTDRPPWASTVSKPDLAPVELIQLARQQTNSQEVAPATIYNVVGRIQESWHRHMTWRIDRGGRTAGELKTLFRIGDTPAGAEKLAMLRRDEAEKTLITWLREQSHLPFNVEDVLDWLVIVHDDLSPGQLASAYWCGTNDVRVRENEFEGINPRQTFADVIRRRGSKLQLVHRKSTGFAADFYLPTAPAAST